MNYQETLDYIYHKLPMYSRMGSAAFKKDLTNIRQLCEHIDNPHRKFKSIHVGGTNGKGSVSHMLAAIFQAAGYKTGLYTSPHLYDFRERIRINGEMIPEGVVMRFVEEQKPLIEELEPSFFEITVAMAFQYFAEEKIDIALIEVGLGGRLDSTNIITPELSMITNIGWDHMNMLGDTLEAIAGEKAGIIKKEIPVVIGTSLPQTKPVFEQIAAEKNAPVVYAEEQYQESHHELRTTSLAVTYKRQNGSTLSVETDLQGIYQVENIRTVLTAVDVLKHQHWQLPEETVLQALTAVKQRTGLGGRWEVIHRDPTIVLEVAHNEDGIQKMLQHLKETDYDQLHLVIGMVKDKEVEKVLRLLPQSAVYYFTQATIPRALPAGELLQKAKQANLVGNCYQNANEAIAAALEKANKHDLVVVCGSIFLVAEVKKF
jgi:dihydrofolate synthase/folylpolyglutamate synthase